jgi:hypothetical protein
LDALLALKKLAVVSSSIADFILEKESSAKEEGKVCELGVEMPRLTFSYNTLHVVGPLQEYVESMDRCLPKDTVIYASL